MPASWSNFITNVSDKFSSQSLKSNKETADYITDQYVSATVGKAQSPFGNTHQSGQKTIMALALKKGMDELFKRPSPTFQERETDPKFSDLTGEIPSGPSGGYNVITEYLLWAEENPNLAPNFIFTPLFESPSVYPSSLDSAIPLLAQKVLSQYDGTKEFYEWLYTLPIVLGNLGKRIYDEFINITTNGGKIEIGTEVYGNAIYRNENYNYKQAKALGDNIIFDRISSGKLAQSGDSSIRIRGKISNIVPDKLSGKLRYYVAFQKDFSDKTLTVNKEVYPETITTIADSDSVKSRSLSLKSKLNFTNKALQVSSEYDSQNQIPKWLNQNLIIKLTYVKAIDTGYLNPRYDFFGYEIVNPERLRELNIKDTVTKKSGLYGNNFGGEVKKWFDSLIAWGNFLADEAKKLNNSQQGDQNDPYEIMAKGVIGYWISTITQPLSIAPPVPPCSIPTPGNYIGLFYGNQKLLADNLRRAFNTGKASKIPGLEKTAAKAVASGLAISFALHLAELKFLYNGQITTPGGPVPMIGFIPLVY